MLASVGASSAVSAGRLHLEEIFPNLISEVLEVRNLGIGVQTEDLWHGQIWELFNILIQNFLSNLLRNLVVVRTSLSEEERTVLIKQEITHVFIEIRDQTDTVIRVRDSTTIRSLTDQISQCLPRN